MNKNTNAGRGEGASLSVVLSFYNEAGVLAELISRLRTVMRAEQVRGTVREYELVFVNDASTDDSLDILKKEFEAEHDLVIINMSNNFGVSECVLAGMRYAKGDVVVYMDADLQDPPEVIPELLDKWHADPEVEVVYTTRLSRKGEHPLKLFITHLGYKLINRISEIELPENSGDFKLLSRRVVQELLKMREKKPYLRGLVTWIGFKQSQVFYHRAERLDGRENTKRPAFSSQTIRYALDSAIISFSDAPLKAMLLLGFCLSTISLIYIAVVVFQKIMGWYEPGWPALMAAILLLGGIQLLMLGILGLYVNVIFANTKGRPDYIIKDIIAADERGNP
jgi:polyisoprenyl-phosphate glycosyltransferase